MHNAKWSPTKTIVDGMKSALYTELPVTSVVNLTTVS